MSRAAILVIALIAPLASADSPKQATSATVFPLVVGTELTFSSKDPKDTWSTKLTATGKLVQYVPHADIINFFSKAGMRVDKDGIYIVGETLADLGDPPPPAARAIAFPIKKGGIGKVPGMIATTYTVGARERVKVPAGSYDAWKITLTDSAKQTGAVWIAPGIGLVRIQLPTGRIDELTKISAAK